MCPSDSDFPATLKLFAPPPPHEDAWYEKMWKGIYGAVDWIIQHIALIGEILTVLSPVLVPLVVGRIAWLYTHAPVMETILDPVLPDKLKPEKASKEEHTLADERGEESKTDKREDISERKEAHNIETASHHSKLIYMGHGEYVPSP